MSCRSRRPLQTHASFSFQINITLIINSITSLPEFSVTQIIFNTNMLLVITPPVWSCSKRVFWIDISPELYKRIVQLQFLWRSILCRGGSYKDVSMSTNIVHKMRHLFKSQGRYFYLQLYLYNYVWRFGNSKISKLNCVLTIPFCFREGISNNKDLSESDILISGMVNR